MRKNPPKEFAHTLGGEWNQIAKVTDIEVHDGYLVFTAEPLPGKEQEFKDAIEATYEVTLNGIL